MKVLFLTPQVPYPPRQGAALRNWGLISGLAARHEVAVLSFLAPSPPLSSPKEEGKEKRTTSGGEAEETADPLRAVCHVDTVQLPERTLHDRLRDLLTTRQPDMALRLASEPYAERLSAWLARESFDVVQIGGIEMAPYLDTVRAARPQPLIVFDNLNCEYLLQQRALLTDLRVPARWPGAAYSFVQWQRLRRYEAQVCRRADRVLAVSDADAEMLRKLVPGLEVTVVPNGVDMRAYPPTPSRPDTPPTLVFTGTMDFRPNVDAVLWFVRKVWPQIRAEVPEAHFFVVGQRPHRRLDGLRGDPAITLTGWVDDARPYIAQATVYVAPLRIGGGTRLKRELLLADTPSAFAGAVMALLRAPERRVELGRAARVFVEQRYDWRAIVPRLEAVYGPMTSPG